jgi:hypothetical protein
VQEAGEEEETKNGVVVVVVVAIKHTEEFEKGRSDPCVGLVDRQRQIKPFNSTSSTL